MAKKKAQTDEKEPTFEQAYERLTEIAAELEGGETSLDEIRDLLARNDLQLAGSAPPPRLPDQLVEGAEPEDAEDILSQSIDLLGLSTRSRKCMERLGVETLGELAERSEAALLAEPNFGRTSVAEVKSKLAALGLNLRQEDEDEDLGVAAQEEFVYDEDEDEGDFDEPGDEDD